MHALLENRGLLLHGIAVTVKAGVLTLLLSTGLGFVVAAMRMSRQLGFVARAYVELFQNVPYLILVFLMYYGLPELKITLPAVTAAILGLSLYSSAYIAESLRSGVLAVSGGQLDAATASGLKQREIARSIVLNQALVYSLPAVTNQWSRIIKNTTVLAIVGGEDLLFEAANLSAITFAVFAFYAFAGVAYWLLSIPVTTGSRVVERLIPWRRAELGLHPLTLPRRKILAP